MQQWRVSDVMTTEVVTAPLDTTVGKLVDIMSTNRISAVPVVGDDRVVGIVSQADLLQGLRPPIRVLAGRAAVGQPKPPRPPPGT